MSVAKQIAARATAAKWGGTPEVRDLARDILALLGELEDARDRIAELAAQMDAADESDEARWADVDAMDVEGES